MHACTVPLEGQAGTLFYLSTLIASRTVLYCAGTVSTVLSVLPRCGGATEPTNVPPAWARTSGRGRLIHTTTTTNTTNPDAQTRLHSPWVVGTRRTGRISGSAGLSDAPKTYAKEWEGSLVCACPASCVCYTKRVVAAPIILGLIASPLLLSFLILLLFAFRKSSSRFPLRYPVDTLTTNTYPGRCHLASCKTRQLGIQNAGQSPSRLEKKGRGPLRIIPAWAR